MFVIQFIRIYLCRFSVCQDMKNPENVKKTRQPTSLLAENILLFNQSTFSIQMKLKTNRKKSPVAILGPK